MAASADRTPIAFSAGGFVPARGTESFSERAYRARGVSITCSVPTAGKEAMTGIRTVATFRAARMAWEPT